MDPASPPTPPARLYCSACGGRLDEAGVCVLCSARPQAPALDNTLPGASVRAALWLYFLFLGTTIVGAIIIRVTGSGNVTPSYVELGIEAVDTVLVIAACIVGWRFVRPGLGLPSLKWFGIAAAAAPATYLLAHLIVSGLAWAMGIHDLNYTKQLEAAGFRHPFALALLTICL